MSHRKLSLSITAIGVALLAYMIPVEGEPGLIPLLLILLGLGWYFVARAQTRSH